MSLPADEPTRPQRRHALPSYRRRYTQVLVILVIALALVAVLAYRHAVTEVDSVADRAALHATRMALLDAAVDRLHRVRQRLHESLLTPPPGHDDALDRSLQQLDMALTRLARGHAGHGGDTATLTTALQQDVMTLRSQIGEWVAKRDEPRRWPPSTRLIDDELQVSDDRFVAHLDAAIAALRDSDDAAARAVLLRLFDLQKAWLRMIGELHLVIADRIGAHAAEPGVGRPARERNVRRQLRQVDTLLAALAAAIDDARPAASAALPTDDIRALGGHADRWQRAFARLVRDLDDGDWRQDLGLLRTEIEPLLQTMQQRLDGLRTDLQARRRQQLDTLSAAGHGLGSLLLAATLLLLLVGALGYLSLDRLILRPIEGLADARKRRAPGVRAAPPPAVAETRDLVDAFADLQAKVTEAERELEHLAHHDALTGLPNRALLRRRLGEAIDNAAGSELLVGLLFMDLDRFKQINDSYGHAAGDRMLVEIGRRLHTVFRQDDLVARLGGDEFAVLLENIHARDEMVALADKALDAIERPYAFDGHLFYSGASIGIAVAPDDGTDPDRLIQLADAAMYACKQDEGSGYRFVSSELSTHAAARHTLENELRSALRQHELELHFQPVVTTAGDVVHCYEALLRWPHAEQGLLQPASFMGALVDAGLCGNMSDWVLDRIHTRQPDPDAVVSFNLSARLLHDADFAHRLIERIESGRLDPRRLILEVTEDTLETDLQGAAPVLARLQQRGVRIALDDFGTGQASLSHLRRFPFDYVKIDRSFIAGIGRVPDDEKLIDAIIGLAHALGMRVVAEGVEQEAQRAFLADRGCDYIQGFLVGKPAAGDA
ncbi:MAG: EAL domain-containing protein [Gammaproteobacteria bacterium]|nr:EAL domain-containing protein [Gammaproteobacteria bacterium]